MRASTEIAAVGAAIAAGVGSALWILWRSRRDPLERERRRRMLVNQHGRTGDGYITDFSDDAVFYTYTVHGVEYESSQDIASVRDALPENLNTIIGPVTVKYLAASPENSIIVGEQWFGLRTKKKPTGIVLKGA